MRKNSNPAAGRITFEASYSPTGGTVVLIRDEQGGIAGPIASLPATGRDNAVQAMATRGYTPVGQWDITGLGNHVIALAQVG